MMVSASALAVPTLASPPIAEASPTLFDAAAVLQRLEQMVETLRTRHVCDGRSLDEAAAENSLAYCRRLLVDPEPHPDEEQTLISFIGDHGQSLDWIIRGDPSGMICARKGFRTGLEFVD